MFKKLLVIASVCFVLVSISIYLGYQSVKKNLPPMITLDDYKPLLVSNVYDRDNKKIGEFFRERRILIPYKNIPKNVVNAFLAAEDDTFFEHKGVNFFAILRASAANFKAGRSVQGGSTITQQVAKTLMLSNEKTYLRKVKEALLAFDIEEHLSKEDILYLYLNQIYFGQSAYGIEMASETYFRKKTSQLSLSEMTMLAGLPKAPSAFSPVHNPSRSKERQIYILKRMAELKFITHEEAEVAINEPLKVYLKEDYQDKAPFFLETVRLQLVDILGENKVLDQGLKIYTSLDSNKQQQAQQAVLKGLKELDKRQGYRGALKNLTDEKEIQEFLFKSRAKMFNEVKEFKIITKEGKFEDESSFDLEYSISKSGIPNYIKKSKSIEGIVTDIDDKQGLVLLKVAEIKGAIDFASMTWARKPNPEKKADQDLIKVPSQALKVGDIVKLSYKSDSFKFTNVDVKNKKDKKALLQQNFSDYAQFELDQDPQVEGSLLSLDQKTEDVLAMVGGSSFEKSQFNRVLQSLRQTGSAFKALVYAAALDKGYNASTPIMDAPLAFEESEKSEEGQEETKIWRPENHSKGFSGEITFRNALVQSLNVPTVKIIEDIGVKYVTDYAHRLGIFSPLNPDFTLALGSSGVTLYEMVKVFSHFGRMGKKMNPKLIYKVEDHKKQKILDFVSLDRRFEKETAEIEKSFTEKRAEYLKNLSTLDPLDKDKLASKIFFEDENQLISQQTAFLITSLLRGVVEDPNGTGLRAKSLGREVAGKTGSSNGYFDAWFVGYTPQIVTGVWVGYDQEKSIGRGEVGGRAALPIWLNYMTQAHEGLAQESFTAPEGIVFVDVDSKTGKPAKAGSKNILKLPYLQGNEPSATKTNNEDETEFLKQDSDE